MKTIITLLSCFFIVSVFSINTYAGVDLVVNVNDSGFDPSIAGENITYPIRVTNDGDTDATNVSVAITLPNNSNFVSAIGAGVSCGAPAAGVVTCDYGNLNTDSGAGAGERSADIVVQSTQASTGLDPFIISITATSDIVDDDTSNDTNQTEATTISTGADVELSISGAASVASGNTYSYTYTVTNNGPDDAIDQRITAPVPTGFEVATTPAGCSVSGGNIICDISSSISSGSSTSITPITGQIVAVGPSTVTASASVGLSPTASNSAPEDPDTDNNTFDFDTTVEAGTDLSISITRNVSENILVGESFNFTITSQYSGNDPDTITISTTLPSEYDIDAVAVSQNGWTCGVSGQVVTCTLPSGIGDGNDQVLGEITIPVTVNIAASNITTTASISALSPTDPNAANDSDNDNDNNGSLDLLTPTVDLGLEKIGPEPALAVVGEPIEYTSSIPNSGTATFTGNLTITENIPTGFTLDSISPTNNWVCTPTAAVGPATISCSQENVSIDSGDEIDGPVLILIPTVDGPLDNTGTITADTCNLATCNDGDPSMVSVTASNSVISTDVSLLKTVDLDPVPAGDILTYTLEVINEEITPGDNVTASNVLVEDTFNNLITNTVGASGAGFIDFTYNDNGSGAVFDSCSTSGLSNRRRALTCTITSLPICTQGTNCPTITARVRSDDPSSNGIGGNRTNNASAVSQVTADPDASPLEDGNNSSGVTSAVEPRADVTVTITDTPDPVVAGQNLTYVITASNVGPSRADSTSIKNTLPDNVVFVSATPSVGSCSITPTVNNIVSGGIDHIECNVGNLSDGGQETVTVVVRPLTATRNASVSTSVDVATTTIETNTLTNIASTTTSVTNPDIDLFVNVTESVDPAAVGNTMVYSIRTQNNGPSAAEAVTLTVVLPDEGFLDYQSINANGVVCNPLPSAGDISGATFTCDIGYLEDGDIRDIDITMNGIAKGVAVVDVSVTSTESLASFDSNNTNNIVIENTTVRTKADMEVVSKEPQNLSGASISAVNLRENFQFLVRVRNNTGVGRAEADDVELKDSLPSGMELTGTPTVAVTSGTASATACTGVAGSISFTCDLGTVSSGGIVDITVPVQMIAVPSGTITNTATVSTSSLDVDDSNNSNSGSITVGNVLSSSIAGTVFRDYDNSGALNGSEVGIPNVTINLSGNTFDNAPVTRTVTTNSSGQFSITELPASDASGYTITEVISDPDLADGVETAGTEGGDTSVNDSITIVLDDDKAATGYLFAEVPISRIGLAKSAGGFTPHSSGGTDITLTFNVENAGGAPLTNIQITDDLSEFGTYTSNASIIPGQYTIASGPTITATNNGASFVANSSFTGVVGNLNLLTAASSSLPNFDESSTGTNEASNATVTVTVRFWPTISGLTPIICTQFKPLGVLQILLVTGSLSKNAFVGDYKILQYIQK